MHKDARRYWGSGAVRKACVQGFLTRGGDLRCVVTEGVTKYHLQIGVRKNIAPGSAIFTDAAGAFQGLERDYIHGAVNHLFTYVRGRVHTNGLENFWTLLKRSLGGTYVAVAPKHLERYLDEQTFRSDFTRFLETMLNITGKRLTFKELTCD